MRACLSISSLSVTLRKYPVLSALLLAAFLFSACSARKQSGQKSDESAAAAESEAEPSAQPTPAVSTVTVHISYGHRGDYLESLSVAKFASATLITAHEEKAGTVVVRFEGGEPVWEIAADRGVSGSLLGHMPGVEENKKFALTEVTYGAVPKHFLREQPDNSDPEPLERGKYYIFTVRRGSGSVDYQALHVADDGTIEGYDAQPRAGTSYALCCNIAPDFAAASTGSGADAPRP